MNDQNNSLEGIVEMYTQRLKKKAQPKNLNMVPQEHYTDYYQTIQKQMDEYKQLILEYIEGRFSAYRSQITEMQTPSFSELQCRYQQSMSEQVELELFESQIKEITDQIKSFGDRVEGNEPLTYESNRKRPPSSQKTEGEQSHKLKTVLDHINQTTCLSSRSKNSLQNINSLLEQQKLSIHKHLSTNQKPNFSAQQSPRLINKENIPKFNILNSFRKNYYQ